MSLKETLRNRIVELRLAERELVEQQQAVEVELLENRAEQERTKQLLVRDAQTSLRMQEVTTHQSARATVARLGGFTQSELQSALGWERPRVKKLLDTMACEKPPAITQEGKVGPSPFYRYTGKPIEQIAEAEREAAALEAVREWALTQSTRFTPAECAAALDQSRAATLRALRRMEQLGAVEDVSPTADMEIFQVTGTDAPDVAIDRPDLQVVNGHEPMSKIPQIQELIEAAQAAQCEVTPATGHFAIEALDGRRVIIDAKPQGRSRLMQDKSKLRRLGVRV